MKPLIKFLYIFAALLPFQFALNIAPGFDVSIIRVAVLFLFGAMILKSFLKKDFFISANLQSGCLILFLAINIFSMFLVKNTEFSLRKILFLGSVFPLYFVVVDIYRDKLDKDFILKLIKWMVWGGAASFFVGMIIFLGQFIFGIDSVLGFYQKIGPFFWGNTFSLSIFNHQSFLVNVSGKNFLRLSSFFPDPHNFALFAGMVCFLALTIFLYYLKEQGSASKTGFYGAIFLLGVMSVFLSFSRGAYLALFGGVFAVFVLGFKNKKIKKVGSSMGPDKKSLRSALAYLFFLIVLLLVFILSPARNRFIDIFSFSDGSNVGRIQIMKDGFNIFKEHFLLGVGIGNAPLYYNEDIDYRSPSNSHNTYLEIAIESGIGGLVVWLALLGGTILQLFRRLRSRLEEANGLHKYLCLGLFGTLIFFAIHSVFEVFLYSPVNLSVIMILLAVSSIILEERCTS